MKWSLIQKIPNPSLEGNYENPAVKEHLRQEGDFRCVYCAVSENKLGGFRAFHVEHYKPKSRPEFSALMHQLSNLFYVCPICNSFKSNTWPADPTPSFDVASYPDPSLVDYSILFDVGDDGLVEGTSIASKYIITQLYFNRPQLIFERRQFLLDEELQSLRTEQNDILNSLRRKGDNEANRHLTRIHEATGRLMDLFLELQNVPLYEPNDIRKQR